ncbi:MAG: protease modulator HflC [Planctomycetota bacterium]
MERPTSLPHRPLARRGAARATLVWLFAALASFGGWASTFVVQEGEVAVVARFGDPRRVVEEPGLHFKWPAPVDSVYPIDSRSHLLDPPIAEFLTVDQKNVEVDAFVAWRVEDPRVFLTSLRDRYGADDRIGKVLQSVVGEVLKRGPFDDLVGPPDRERTLADVRRELTELVAARCRENDFGVAIELVGIERITFPEINKAAVERSMSAKREGYAANFLAEGKEKASQIDSESGLDNDRVLAEADETALQTRGEARAARVQIRQEMIALNPELYARLRELEIAETAMRGQTILLPADHWMTRVFDLAAPAPSPAQKDERDEQ